MAGRGGRRSPIWIGLAACAGLLAIGAAAAWAAFYVTFLRDLPDLHGIADYRPLLATVVLDRHGRPVGEFFEERRRLVSLEEVPEHVVLAFVAGEDDAFFEHRGIDYRSIVRAAWVDLTSGEIRQGASTITQQTVKTLLLTPERRFSRKIKELILARRLEERLTKEEILYLYLNQIYFGNGAWGIGEAARSYFGKPVRELDVSEGALLAGLPKAPSRFSPMARPEAAEKRRQYVLRRMLEEGYLDPAAYEEALASRPELLGPAEQDDFEAARWFTEEVRRRLFEQIGGERVLREGLVVETTLDLDLQHAAVAALRRGLEALDRRQGWLGPVRRVPATEIPVERKRLAEENGFAESLDHAPGALPSDRPLLGVVTHVDSRTKTARVALGPEHEADLHLVDLEWAQQRREGSGRPTPLDQVLRVGDVARFAVIEEPSDGAGARVVVHQEPGVEGAVLSFELGSGDVLAMVGGYDFTRSEFNRAVQASRQPGSAFKPIIYSAALSRGYTPVTIIHDRPVIYSDPETGFTWRPENYGRRFLGPIPLRMALARSVNNATIHLLRDVGVANVVRRARRLGIRASLEADLSLALGSSPVSLLELTRAYAAFGAGGRRVEPRFIVRVRDRDGNVLLENLPLGEADAQPLEPEPASLEAEADLAAPPALPDGQLVPEAEAYLVTDLLRGVIEDPHGTGRRARSLGHALAGKTGTTNDQGDAWFVGFSPDVATGVWVGYDERRVLGPGETGGRAALPIWMDVMKTALAERPEQSFPVPPGIVFARVDRETGLLAEGDEKETVFQAFLAGTEPTETAARALPESESRRLLRLDF